MERGTPRWSHKEPLVTEKTRGWSQVRGNESVHCPKNRIKAAVIYRLKNNFSMLCIKLVEAPDGFDCDVTETPSVCACVCAHRPPADQYRRCRCSKVSGWLCAACPHAIPRSLPPAPVIYSAEQPQRLCATENCHRRNLSPRRADQQSRPPPPTEATEYFDLSSAAILPFKTWNHNEFLTRAGGIMKRN